MNTPYVFKKCSKCGRWLVASSVNFHKSKTGKYGLRADCKECDNNRSKKYRMEHREECIKYHRKYKKENKEYFAEYNKKYIEENREAILEKQKKYREENKDTIARKKKIYYEEHKEEIAKQMKKYREEHKEELAEYMKEYHNSPQGQVVRFNSHNKRRKRKEQQGNGITGDQWLEMMNFFDWKCAYSDKSISIKENRSIDHIVPLAKGGEHDIWNLVPMDRRLNSSKCDRDIKEWYPQQDFYNEDRLNKI